MLRLSGSGRVWQLRLVSGEWRLLVQPLPLGLLGRELVSRDTLHPPKPIWAEKRNERG